MTPDSQIMLIDEHRNKKTQVGLIPRFKSTTRGRCCPGSSGLIGPLRAPSPADLDIFGLILYSMLTFMALMSMLVYLEECVYIYRKVPANKKSPIVWVNGAAPVRTLKGNYCFTPDQNYLPF